MAKTRRDDRGRVLKKGEVHRASDNRYMCTYTDPMGRRRFIYEDAGDGSVCCKLGDKKHFE